MAGSPLVILAIDTATSRTDVALVDDERVIAHLHADGATSHGEVLASLVQQALASAFTTAESISAIAVGTGPGPFTGLRVGLTFARTLAFARSIPVHGLCTLDVLAAGVRDDSEFLVATDARRKEIYWARYQGGERIEGPHVSKPDVVAAMHPDLLVAGEGAHTYSALFPYASEPLFPSAVDLALLAQRWLAEGRTLPIEPQYLRQPDVTL
jgi:tRNA threonylcarbamoyl adenosine modification protein YeaZ